MHVTTRPDCIPGCEATHTPRAGGTCLTEIARATTPAGIVYVTVTRTGGDASLFVHLVSGSLVDTVQVVGDALGSLREALAPSPANA